MSFKCIIFNDVHPHHGTTRAVGAYTIATTLKNIGYETLVINFSFIIDWHRFTQLMDLSIDDDTLIVGFSTNWFEYQVDVFQTSDGWKKKGLSFNFQKRNIKPYIDYIKSINSKIKIIAGGFNSHNYISETSIDHIFIGYSESQIQNFIKSVETGKSINRIIKTDIEAKQFDFKNSMTEYSDYDILHSDEILYIEFARGCLFKCTFCSYPMIGKKSIDYLKYKEVIYNEFMTNYERWGITKYAIVDDTFNDSIFKLELIYEIVKELPFVPEFHGVYVRIDLFNAHPKMAKLLKEINVKSVYWGIETWHPEAARIVKKGGSREKKISALKIARDCWGNDIDILSGVIIGLPGDTEESITEFCEWYENEGHRYLDQVSFFILRLRDEDKLDEYIHKSEFEKNKKKYGFVVLKKENSNTNTYNEWYRSESNPNEIQNIFDAQKILNKSKERLEKFQKENSHLIKKHAGASIITKSLKEKLNLEGDTNVQIMKNFAEQYYYPKLIEKLNADRN
jgi:radical SAM superfamily enzyme YgiQ (UPF0313 family)